MKQIQFGTYQVSTVAEINKALRTEMETVLNNGWELHSWNVVERGVDANNQPVVFIAVCMTRDTGEDVPTAVKEEKASD